MPRTVLYLTPSSRLLGARRSLHQLVTHLDPERYRPVVATQSEGDLVDALRESGVPVRTLFLGWWRKGRYMPFRPFRIAQLARLVRESGADLIHCNEFFPNPYAVRAAAKARDIPVVTHMRLSISPRRIRNYDLRRAARIICVSHAAAHDFAAVWTDWRQRVEVVYNGVDESSLQSTMSPEQVREELDLSPKDFVVGMFGLLAPRKRQHLLLEAASLIKKAGRGGTVLETGVDPNRLRVLIVGNPGRSNVAYEQELHRKVEREGLSEMVRFQPFAPNVGDYYQVCNVNALISNLEGFGRTIIEAGALGIPSIGSRVGGIPELIEDGETGCLIPADDDGTALAEAITNLADPRVKRAEAMGKKTRARVQREFSIEAHAERIMNVYDRVLERV